MFADRQSERCVRWLEDLRDLLVLGKVLTSIARLMSGNPGLARSVRGEEMYVHFNDGLWYSLYYLQM
mgnify:CR=1 FL=1